MKRFFLFSCTLLLLDFFSKMWAYSFLPPVISPLYPFGGIPLFSLGPTTFSLNLAINTGAAWGLFQNHPGLLFCFRIAIISLAFFFFFKKEKASFAFWLILTGAIGNAVDYLVYGYVVDFFHFTFFHKTFPIFNFADSYITLGACALFALRRKHKISSPTP